jgi:putative membrane protein
MKQLHTLLACAAAVLLPVFAQTQSANRLAKPDSDWAMKAAQGGMAEVKLGQLAAEKGTNQSVKDFGQTMVTDHTKANNELMRIAGTKGITLPSSLDSKDQSTYDKLSKLSGAEFDREYISDMIKDHKTDISEFEKESKSGGDADLKNFATTTLPTLKHHLEMAESAQTAVKK